jgi:type IV pilus assembly protein PilC
MQLFHYTAKDKDGEVLSGEIEAENETAASKVLMSRDLAPIIIKLNEEKSFSFLNKVSLKDKVALMRQLSTMITAGLPIAQSLKTLEEQTKKKNVKRILTQTGSDIEGGSQLSAAFSKFPETFSALDITLIASGETSGNLDKSLGRLASQLEKQQSLLRKIRGAFVYPAFVIVVVIVVAAIMVIYVMPQMEELYKSFGAQLPFITRVLISISHFTSRFAPLIIIALVGLGAWLRIAVRRPAGRKVWDKLKITLYPINILLQKLYMARMSRTLSGLIASGVPLLDSLAITAKAIGNVIYEEKIKAAAKKVKSGIALSETLKNDPIIPPIAPQMINVGERTGELDSMLENMANYFEEEVDNAVKNISNLIEPMVIVLLALIIGTMLVAIMMPIYSIGKVL